MLRQFNKDLHQNCEIFLDLFCRHTISYVISRMSEVMVPITSLTVRLNDYILSLH